MAKQICGGLGSNPDENITTTVLARHLGVSRNTVPAITAKFALTKWDSRFRKYDVFRHIHGLDPLLMDTFLVSFKTAHSRSIGDGTCDADDTVGRICLIDELSGINNLASALWDQGLIRKKLKSGDINLPPIQPIELSSNRVMYRPLDVVLWRRHGIVMNLPKADGSSSDLIHLPSSEHTDQTSMRLSLSDSMTSAVFAAAIAATDEKSDISATPAHSPDVLHNTRP